MSRSTGGAQLNRANSNQTGRSSVTLNAYQRASAAYHRLEKLSRRVDELQQNVQEAGQSDPWDERVAAYLAVRREWNDAFREFDEAVNDYAAALWTDRLTECADQCGRRSTS